MSKCILMNIKDIQPSQLYINSQKLKNILKWFTPTDYESYDAIPIKIIYTDGHTWAYAAYIKGVKTIKVYWDEDELSWNAYQICVDWCNTEGINSIEDLKDRVIEPNEYEILWYDRCRNMHNQLGI
ncbi:hypothetical protein [Clostridium sp.]